MGHCLSWCQDTFDLFKHFLLWFCPAHSLVSFNTSLTGALSVARCDMNMATWLSMPLINRSSDLLLGAGNFTIDATSLDLAPESSNLPRAPKTLGLSCGTRTSPHSATTPTPAAWSGGTCGEWHQASLYQIGGSICCPCDIWRYQPTTIPQTSLSERFLKPN